METDRERELDARQQHGVQGTEKRFEHSGDSLPVSLSV
jgi:hypothetical protein